MAASVPVVDLSLPIEDVTQHVRRACSEFGFFYVVQHGVDQDLIDRQFEENRKLFALPLEVKMQMLADQNNRGYTPFAEETLNPSEQTEGDTKEGFYFGREVAPGTLEGQKPLHGPNQWPSKKLLPDYQAVIEHYFHALHHLGMRLLQLLARALELEPTFFDSRFDPPMLFLRPLHYGAKQSDPRTGVFGAGAHTDYGMLTILASDEQPGLQVLLDGEWVDVPPKPGMLIINLGDMLERWTNRMFRSALHRVVNQTGEERYSTAFFFEPSFDTLVECLPQCCRDQPPRFPPTTAGQHLLDKYAATHSGYRGPTVANEVARINTPVGAAWD